MYSQIKTEDKSYGVSGNTFRAFGRNAKAKKDINKLRPSETFLEWAHSVKDLGKVAATRETLRKWKYENAKTLRTLFYENGVKIPSKRSKQEDLWRYVKLIDLFIKQSILNPDLGSGIQENLRCNFDVPLDKFSLAPIRDIYNTEKPKELPEMPLSSSMGWITSEKQYEFIQDIICELTDNDPFKYDVYSWNLHHLSMLEASLLQKLSDV